MRAGAQEAIELLGARSSDDLRADRVLQLALTHLVEIIGEAARRVSAEGRSERPEVPWQAIMAMRNRLAHDYRDVDLDVLCETVRADLPALIRQLGEP